MKASVRGDAVADEVFRHLFVSIAEEMGVTLERTAYSPNIKERRDHSCAIFDASGRLLAQAAHIPVHLGAFPKLMEVIVPQFDWKSGDVLICNDPFVGGTHLPDISLVSPVWDGNSLAGFVANRAHHADVGGTFPGSMGPSTEIHQEGLIIPPLKLVAGGIMNDALMELICRNVRTPIERVGDLRAQLAANATGVERFEQVLRRYGAVNVQQRADAARSRSKLLVEQFLEAFPAGVFEFEDYLDLGGFGKPLPIRVGITKHGSRLMIDFEGTAPQQAGPINATLAVTHSAVYYVLVCLLPSGAELNQGVFGPLDIRAPSGSLVNARPPAAVAGGNVETSQRIVDALLGALAQALPMMVPAASQGTMNNVTLGGSEPEPWAYYETMGGGAGAGPHYAGVSGIHCHMSNTRNTPAEALEYHYPLRVRRYGIREGSGGAGINDGGCGLVREIELLADCTLSLLTERRLTPPYGLQGGTEGELGRNLLWENGSWRELGGNGSFRLRSGQRVRIETPGGGGWGAKQGEENP